jgi:hypothetical protein
MKFKVNIEVIVELDARNIDAAERLLKKRFDTTDTKFYQVIDYEYL